HVDAVQLFPGERVDRGGCAVEDGGGAAGIAPGRVGDAHGELRQSAPQRPVGARGLLPVVLEDVVRMEGAAPVEELLAQCDGFGRGARDALGLAWDTLGAVRQWAPEG